MAIVLCDDSALTFWRGSAPTVRAAESQVPSEEADTVLRSFLPMRSEVDFVRARLGRRGEDRAVTHLLVSNPDNRRAFAGIRCHVCSSPLPEGALCVAGHGVYVTSPDFCLLRVAATEDLVGTLLLASELCGLYALRPGSEKGLVQRRVPLTSVPSLASFLRQSSGIDGVKRLSSAVDLVAGRIASPMESRLHLLLCLPRRMGGYGLPAPIPNFEESVLGRAAHLTSKHWCSTDLCWPDARLIFEYDSDAEHVGANRIASDSERRDALTDMLYQVYTVTNRQIHSERAVDELAHVVARSMGIRWRRPGPGFSDARRALRHRLFCGD